MARITLSNSYKDRNDVYWGTLTTINEFDCYPTVFENVVTMLPESKDVDLHGNSQLYIYCPSIPEVMLIHIRPCMYKQCDDFIIRFPTAGGYVVHLQTKGSFLDLIKIIIPKDENFGDKYKQQTCRNKRKSSTSPTNSRNSTFRSEKKRTKSQVSRPKKGSKR